MGCSAVLLRLCWLIWDRTLLVCVCLSFYSIKVLFRFTLLQLRGPFVDADILALETEEKWELLPLTFVSICEMCK